MNKAHKEQERAFVERFLAARDGRATIATFEQGEAPDVVGVLASGKPFGLEVVTVTDERLAEGGSLLKVFTRELDAALQWRTLMILRSRSMSDQRRPHASPFRMPV